MRESSGRSKYKAKEKEIKKGKEKGEEKRERIRRKERYKITFWNVRIGEEKYEFLEGCKNGIL